MYLTGYHSYSLYNDTQQKQNYTIVISLCVDNSCFKETSYYIAESKRHYSSQATSHLTKSFNYPGNYRLVAYTGMSGAGLANNSGSDTVTINE